MNFVILLFFFFSKLILHFSFTGKKEKAGCVSWLPYLVHETNPFLLIYCISTHENILHVHI